MLKSKIKNQTNTRIYKNLMLILLFVFGSVSLFNNSYAAQFDSDQAMYSETSQEIPTTREIELPLVKPPIKFIKDDLEVTFGGKIKMEYDRVFNSYYLNKNVPDDIGYFKQTLDLNIYTVFGEKKCGHKAIEAYAALRSKAKWGVIGAYKNTTPAELQLSDISLGEHTHNVSRANPWFKDAWLKFSLNKVMNSDSKKIQYVKAGWFPFQLGRGVAFGPFYATAYEALGLFSYSADSSAPGISVNGELVKDKLWYDLYYAKFEDNSASVSNTFNTLKINHIGRRSNPFRGTAKDDELWAAKLKIKPFDKESSGRLELEPYIYYNEASDQKVEVANDTKTELGAYGIEAKYRKNKFKIGGEVAFNYGQEKLYSIDRNKIQLKTLNDGSNIPVNATDIVNEGNAAYGAGLLYKGYSHVVVNSGGTFNDKSAPVNTTTISAAYDANNITKANSVPYETNQLKNLDTRVRPAYKNDFTGWMGIIDTRYHIAKNFKIAAEYGYASGDNDPHINEVNKNYDGFVGLHELYMGKRVFSPLVLGERSIPRPLGLVAGQTEVGDNFRAKTNNTFSDIQYLGLGATWKPEKFREHRFKLNPNLMLFWKNDESYKYVLDTANPDNSQVSDTQKASSFLGTEASVIFNYELLKDLTLGGLIAVFVPGSYYDDIKGVPLKNDFYRDQLSSTDRANVNPADYRLSNDTAFYAVLSLEYRF